MFQLCCNCKTRWTNLKLIGALSTQGFWIKMDTKTKFQFDPIKSGLLFWIIIKLASILPYLLVNFYVTGTVLKRFSSKRTGPLAGTCSWSLWQEWLFTLQNYWKFNLGSQYKPVFKKFKAYFCIIKLPLIFNTGILFFILEYVISNLNIILHKTKLKQLEPVFFFYWIIRSK